MSFLYGIDKLEYNSGPVFTSILWQGSVQESSYYDIKDMSGYDFIIFRNKTNSLGSLISVYELKRNLSEGRYIQFSVESTANDSTNNVACIDGEILSETQITIHRVSTSSYGIQLFNYINIIGIKF